ncbi:NAD(+) synthase [Thermostilla marina]
MKRIRLAAAALNQTPLAWDDNCRNILAAIEQAREAEAILVCLPELCISGYGCEDAFHSTDMQHEVLAVLEAIVPATRGMIVSIGLPLLHKSALFDAACLAVDGRIAGFVAKRHLAGEGLHYEPRWFKAWPRGVRDEIRIGGRSYPIGDLVFDVGGLNIGFEICEDAWVAKRPGGDMALEGVDVILNPSASHFAFGKHDIRRRFVVEGSRAFGVSYVYANLLGNEAGRIIYDGGGLIASAGNMIAQGKRFSFEPVLLTTAVVDIEITRMMRARTGSYEPKLGGDHPLVVECPFTYPDLDPEVPDPAPEPWEQGPHVKEEEFARAVMLGLFDYLRKSRSRGFVVSVSGGADSSAVACLVALMIEAAHNELGHERFCRALSHMPELRETTSHAQRVRMLLNCVYQATRNSSAATREAAVGLVESLGGSMAVLNVDDVMAAYIGKIEEVLGRPLTWEQDDLALQNIQARARGPSVWLLANVKGALLLATSNRSEAAVGYATMDGDTCGSLSPIAGIDKAFLRRWLKWLETTGPAHLHPVPALAAVTQLPPTAELRPQDKHQTDEDDLMPYEVLDAIERAAIRDKQAPVEVFRLMRRLFPQYTIEQLADWIERFFRLWCRNQWKRERYAPSFHLDDENLDPKTWCRFPIISGGFARELETMRRYARSLRENAQGETR